MGRTECVVKLFFRGLFFRTHFFCLLPDGLEWSTTGRQVLRVLRVEPHIHACEGARSAHLCVASVQCTPQTAQRALQSASERSPTMCTSLCSGSFTVTPLVLTFEGLSLHCNVGQNRDPLSLPEVFFEARGKVMEMEEHSPSRGEPAKLPVALCERRIHTPMYGWRMV